MRLLPSVAVILFLASGPLHARPPRSKPTPRAVVVTAVEVLVEYQRVGRELIQLERLRGHRSCDELWPLFRSIQLEAAVKTPDSREASLEDLAALRDRILRLRGIEVSAECLANPLADACH